MSRGVCDCTCMKEDESRPKASEQNKIISPWRRSWPHAHPPLPHTLDTTAPPPPAHALHTQRLLSPVLRTCATSLASISAALIRERPSWGRQKRECTARLRQGGLKVVVVGMCARVVPTGEQVGVHQQGPPPHHKQSDVDDLQVLWGLPALLSHWEEARKHSYPSRMHAPCPPPPPPVFALLPGFL